MKRWFLSILKKKNSPPDLPPMPPWETIVERMHGQQLDCFSDEVVDVICSRDMTLRYVILKNGEGRYTYFLEALYPWDEDEWQYIGRDPDALPAFWETAAGRRPCSVFGSEADLRKELASEPEYKQFF